MRAKAELTGPVGRTTGLIAVARFLRGFYNVWLRKQGDLGMDRKTVFAARAAAVIISALSGVTRAAADDWAVAGAILTPDRHRRRRHACSFRTED